MARLAVVVAVFGACVAAMGREHEGGRENSILLNGRWEFAVGDGGEGAESEVPAKPLSWQTVVLPGPFMRWSQVAAHGTKVVWARRSFQATAAQAQALAVLRWNRIANGAEAFLNGRKVGENEPTGPYQTIVPADVLQPGENRIVLKIRGAAGVRRSQSGHPLIPAGFGVGMPEVTDDVWIDFAEGAYMKWVLAIPDLGGGRVRIRVTPTGVRRLEDLKILAEVRPWPEGEVVGRGEAAARLVPDANPLGGEPFFVEVPMPGFKPWTHEDCSLYSARVKLTQDGRVLDELRFRFGMRAIEAKDQRFWLNGKTLWLRGSNLVFEWNWGDILRGKEKEYLVTEAREMSMNSFRTHTQPPPRGLCDVCDEHGTMILAEFPVLYNYQDYRFTPDEYAVWHRNVLTDSAGWMARLWNHPSVILWVLSNESRVDDAWEEGPFQEFVNRLDPTRPTLRTGNTTKEVHDFHPCGNVTETDEGHLLLQIPGWFEAAGRRVTTVTEYMNDFGHPRTQWTGVDDRLANDLAVAQIGAEHTEAMRRARIPGIWPYMYAGWTRTRLAARVRETGKGSAVWKAGYASPLSAAWHSSLSPVLASLDLFDANYLVGREVTTDLHVINDSWHDARIRVDLLLTRECPEWIPEAPCFQHPVRQWNFEFAIQADSIQKAPVRWELPHDEGTYWLTARTTGLPGRPVLSQRMVRAIKPPDVPERLKHREFVVLGGGDAARAFFRSRGLRTTTELDALSPDRHRVVVWNAGHLSAEERRRSGVVREFADRGGLVLVLASPSWPWTDLCDVKLGHAPRFSRVFPYPDGKLSLLGGTDPRWLIRWNGLPGAVAVGTIEGPALSHGEKILWAREPKTTVMAIVPAGRGGGRLVFSQLDVQGRLDRSRPHYDPVAERLLLNLLNAEIP